MRLFAKPSPPINQSPAATIRQDLQRISVQPDVDLEVYWKVVPIGKGPALILNACDQQIMKFDCFGKDSGHFHISPHSELRIQFLETSAKAQVKRARLELINNAQYYLNMQQNEKIRNIVIETSNFLASIERSERIMFEFLRDVKELNDI